MEQQPQEPQEGGLQRDRPHQETDRAPDAPRIYVASLADYNAGLLHGTWVDAAQSSEDLYGAVEQMLRASPTAGAEEFAIFDYEGFGPFRLHEYESLDNVAKVAKGIAEYGAAFAHFVHLTEGSDLDPLTAFEDAYLGHWESVEAYAEQLLDDYGYEDRIGRSWPEPIQPYVRVDIETIARDLELSGDITTSEGDGGVYVFQNW